MKTALNIKEVKRRLKRYVEDNYHQSFTQSELQDILLMFESEQFSQVNEGRANKEEPLTFVEFCTWQYGEGYDFNRAYNKNRAETFYQGFLLGLKHTSHIPELSDESFAVTLNDKIRYLAGSFEHHKIIDRPLYECPIDYRDMIYSLSRWLRSKIGQ